MEQDKFFNYFTFHFFPLINFCAINKYLNIVEYILYPFTLDCNVSSHWVQQYMQRWWRCWKTSAACTVVLNERFFSTRFFFLIYVFKLHHLQYFECIKTANVTVADFRFLLCGIFVGASALNPNSELYITLALLLLLYIQFESIKLTKYVQITSFKI